MTTATARVAILISQARVCLDCQILYAIPAASCPICAQDEWKSVPLVQFFAERREV